MIDVLPGLVVLLALLTVVDRLSIWKSVRKDIRALEERVCELEAQRAAILRLED